MQVKQALVNLDLALKGGGATRGGHHAHSIVRTQSRSEKEWSDCASVGGVL